MRTLVVSCNMCGGPLMVLGPLGSRNAVRCRNCGWTGTVEADTGNQTNALSDYGYVSPGLCRDCEVCRKWHGADIDADDELPPDEGGFSRSACDACGSTLAGDRYVAHGVDADGSIEHFDICVDCLSLC